MFGLLEVHDGAVTHSSAELQQLFTDDFQTLCCGVK